MPDTDAAPRSLVALSDYHPPSVPAHHIVERLTGRARRLFGRDTDQAVQDDRLRQEQAVTLQDSIPAPGFDGIVDALAAALDDWQDDTSPAARIRVLVLPPCERQDLMQRVAERHGLAVLDPPLRHDLTGAPRTPIREPGGESEIIVVPRLQHWFLRHHDGLATGRALLHQMASGSRRWLVGVDAWSWRYLARAAHADLLLPPPLTPPAWDADRLADWLMSPDGGGTGGAGGTVSVRTVKGGEDVFARDGDGTLSNDFLRELAARSLGIPWVAWQLWQRGLRTMPDPDAESDEDGEEDEDKSEGEGEGGSGGDEDADGDAARLDVPDDRPVDVGGATRELWVTHDVEPVLPADHRTEALLLLQTLLVHDGLRYEELPVTLPATLEVEALLCALDRAGFIERNEARGDWTVLPSAYPVVRTALAEGGWSMPPF